MEPFMKILIAYDGSQHADIAIDDLQWAGLPQNAEAIVLSVVEWPLHAPRSWGMVDTSIPQEWTMRVQAVEGSAEAACWRIQKQFPGWNVQMETPTGHAAATILERAAGWQADLIVVGTHGRSRLGRASLGSVSMRLAKEAHCSVRVARMRNHDGPIRLIVGDDGSPEAETTLDQVCRRNWPAGTEARVLAVHEVLITTNAERIAISDRLYDQINQDEHIRLKAVATQTAERMKAAGLNALPLIEEGDPREALVRQAQSWKADTIFVGARGLGRVERFLLGSVSSAVVSHAPCSVEIVRQL
jgi:nucleotide-binding universal stress UspA family protein